MWAESAVGSWECSLDKTFAEAEAICQTAGARLCTVAEIGDGCTAGTGCKFDLKLVWASPLPPSAPPPPPAPPPACRDNDIPGFGSLFCILNTDAKYVTESDKEDFCNDPHYKNKCMLTCGECEP